MGELVDVYKTLEDGTLFHTKLEKLKYEDDLLHLSLSSLARKFLMVGDIVSIGYMNILMPGRVAGKNEKVIVKTIYAGEGKLGERTKPRVPVQREMSFRVLVKVDGIFRTFEPIDISEGGLSVSTFDAASLPSLMGRELEFKLTGRDDLSGVSGNLKLVGIIEDTQFIKLAFEMQVDEQGLNRIRQYVVNVIKALMGS